jgi:glycosyltransferase involved in cell wall biosynthesis
MRILFDHRNPFLLAHGGFQVQIVETKRALEDVGVHVELLRWWDDSQRGDLIHFFGPPPPLDANLAHKKGMKYVVTHLLGGLGVRSAWKRFLQKVVIDVGLRTFPPSVLARIAWSGWKTADAYIAVTSWEAGLMTEIFHVPSERAHVVPNGVSDLFFEQPVEARNEWLVTTASIFPVKRLIESAQAAIIAQTPYWVIGRPLSESDSYYQRFSQFCCQHRKVLRFDNAMHSHTDLAEIYRQARGFVLLSRWESQSLSALEAAACECPLLLSDLPWARSTFGEGATYCPVVSANRTARYLRDFYDAAPALPRPPKPARWSEIAQMLKRIYERVLSEADRSHETSS